jgi:hypothetical protein
VIRRTVRHSVTFLWLIHGSACIETAIGDIAGLLGETMRAQTIAVIAVAAMLTSCVDSDRLRSNLGGPSAAAEVTQEPGKQTAASKVLGAIALERITGRTADPARLNELR